MSCGVGLRSGLDPVLLWLWCRPVAKAPIRPLVWEPPYAAGAALKRPKKKKGKKKGKNVSKRGKEGTERAKLQTLEIPKRRRG